MDSKKIFVAKNGAKYVKNVKGQVKFISGAPPMFLNKIRKLKK